VETWGKKKSLAGWWRLFCSGHGDDFGKEGLVTTYPNDLYCKRVTTWIVKGWRLVLWKGLRLSWKRDDALCNGVHFTCKLYSSPSWLLIVVIDRFSQTLGFFLLVEFREFDVYGGTCLLFSGIDCLENV
jgi:hypothetical protein